MSNRKIFIGTAATVIAGINGAAFVLGLVVGASAGFLLLAAAISLGAVYVASRNLP